MCSVLFLNQRRNWSFFGLHRKFNVFPEMQVEIEMSYAQDQRHFQWAHLWTEEKMFLFGNSFL